MAVDKLFEDITYGISQCENDLPHEDYHVRATLSALASVMDHLLEEYNLKFGLRISKNEKDFRNKFYKTVEKSGNRVAISFIKDFRSSDKDLKDTSKNPVIAFLLNLRNIDIHRDQAGTTRTHILYETSHFEDTVRVDRDYGTSTVGSSTVQPQQSPRPPQSGFSFDEWTGKETLLVQDLLQIGFNEIGRVVSNLRSAYP